MSINKTIAESLGMEIPKEEEVDHSLVEIAPHEVPDPVDNPNLPNLADEDLRMLEGEKQLEKLIKLGMNTFTDLDDKRTDIDPKYLSRHIETSSQVFSLTLEAVKHKTDLQLKKKKQKLDEAGFEGHTGKTGATNNFFVGSREDLRKLINSGGIPETEESLPMQDMQCVQETDSDK